MFELCLAPYNRSHQNSSHSENMIMENPCFAKRSLHFYAIRVLILEILLQEDPCKLKQMYLNSCTMRDDLLNRDKLIQG